MRPGARDHRWRYAGVGAYAAFGHGAAARRLLRPERSLEMQYPKSSMQPSVLMSMWIPAGLLAFVADDEWTGVEGGGVRGNGGAAPNRWWRQSGPACARSPSWTGADAATLRSRPYRQRRGGPAVMRTGRPIDEAGLAFGHVPAAPLADGPGGDAGCGCSRGTDHSAPSRWTIGIRLCGTVRAFSWTVVRGFGRLGIGLATTASQPAREGQPP